jgi:hypothetical protein
MHACLTWVASSGAIHGFGDTGGAKRRGGDCANGMPRNMFTTAVADGRAVVVPIITPESRVAVGFNAHTTVAMINIQSRDLNDISLIVFVILSMIP